MRRAIARLATVLAVPVVLAASVLVAVAAIVTVACIVVGLAAISFVDLWQGVREEAGS